MNYNPPVEEMAELEWRMLPIFDGVHARDGDGTKYRGTHHGVDYVVTLHVREDGSACSTSARVEFT